MNQSDSMVRLSMDSFLAEHLRMNLQLINYVNHLDWVQKRDFVIIFDVKNDQNTHMKSVTHLEWF